MTTNNVAELLMGLLQNGNGKQSGKGRLGSDKRAPDEIFEVPGTEGELTIGIYRATHSRDGSRSLFFDARRVKDGKKLKSIRIESLPALILGLFTVARAASRDEEWVDAQTRAQLAFLADHLETVVTASEGSSTNGEASELSENSFFELAA